jgi:hypothetical protein
MSELMIKGATIKAPRDWMRTAYGPEAWDGALAELSPEDRAIVDGPLLEGSWYPLATWDALQAAMREQARIGGDTEHQFNMRNMREAGSRIVRGVYKFVLGLMSAPSVLEKGAVIYNRAYSEGRCELVENAEGRAVVRYCDASPDLRTNLTHNFPTGLQFLLELAGAKHPTARISRDEIVDGKLVFEVTLSYR